jgi:type IV secretion system protein VirB9
MKYGTRVSVVAVAIALSSAVAAQQASQLTPQQVADQLRAYQTAAGQSTPAPTVPAPSAASGQAPPATVGSSAARRAPTWQDKRRLESELRAVNSALKVRQVTDSNTQRASQAIAARGKMLFTFADGGIYELQTATFRQTAIELQPGEVLTGRDLPTAGDTARWTLAITRTGMPPSESVVLIVKPLEADLETNMTVTTNRRIYNVVLKSTEHTYMPLVGWVYPQDEARAAQSMVQQVSEVESQSEPLAVAPDKLNFNCTVSGSNAVWKPLRVYDDGTKTYLQMSPEMSSYEAPAMFVIEKNQPLLVNYRVKRSVYIVDRLFERGQLRVGPKTAVDIRCTRLLARASE